MLLVIGIDGASPELVERLAARGRLPTLRGLMRHGAYGRLESSVNCSPISAWASLLTGTNPGKHGVWDLFNLVPDSYEWQPAHARLLRAPTLLQLLTERGLEAGTLFVPMTFPARQAEWTTVSGWLAPSVEAEGFAYPARIAAMAADQLKDTPLAPALRSYAAAGRFGAGFDVARDAVRAKCSLTEKLLADRKWDFLSVNFVETDRLQRWYWHLIDAAHPNYREQLRADHGHWIEDLYAETDAAIARLAGRLTPSDQLMVVSTYGVGLNNRASECVPEVLERLGLLTNSSAASGHWRRVKAAGGASVRALYAVARRLLPQALARRLPDALTSAPESAHGTATDQSIDYTNSTAFSAPGGHVVLNLKGLFPGEAIPPGSEQQLTRQIVSALSSAIDPATGRRPLDWARPRDQVCHGPYLERIPHIVTRWRSPFVVSGLTVTGRDGQVRIAKQGSGPAPSGAPAPEGILIAAGAGLSRGVRLQGARVEDVAATALYLCGAPVPSYFDGRVLTAAIAPEYLSERPVQVAQRELPKIIDDTAKSEAASQAVSDHLRGLSYLA